MKNIFENTYFGKAYKTRDGRKAMFVVNMGGYYGHPYRLVIEGADNFFNYDEYGMMTGVERDSDIIEEWQEPIDEEKLDELAKSKADEHWNKSKPGYSSWGYKCSQDSYKAGYKQGWEDKQ